MSRTSLSTGARPLIVISVVWTITVLTVYIQFNPKFQLNLLKVISVKTLVIIKEEENIAMINFW